MALLGHNSGNIGHAEFTVEPVVAAAGVVVVITEAVVGLAVVLVEIVVLRVNRGWTVEAARGRIVVASAGVT
jgi:hypothetical protein